MASRVLFTDAEDRLLALGILEYNNDWAAIQKRFLPCKSKHQIFVRQKNRSSSKAPDNPIKDVRHMKTSPLTVEEKQCIQEADNNASEDVENDDDSYVNEAFLEDTDSRSMNLMPCQLSLSKHAGKSMMMQSGTGVNEECGATCGYIEPQKGSGAKLDVTTSYIPFMYCPSDGPSYVRTPSTAAPVVSCGSLDQLPASKLSKEKGGCVVKLAPDLPPVNLPPSVRVLSQLNLFPDHRANSRLQQNEISNDNATEDGAEQDLQMHPLLFQYSRDVVSSYSHLVQNLINQSRKYDLFPLEKVRIERSNSQTTGSTENGTVNANTIDFHPLLQRMEVDVHNEVAEYDSNLDYHKYRQLQPAEQAPDNNMSKVPVDDQSTAGQASTSPSERETSIDLNIHLCSPTAIKDSNDFRSSFSRSNVQDEVSRKDKSSVPDLEVVNSHFHHCIQEPNEESMQGIVMEQEELSDSEEDSQHVEFECEEMDDSEEEQVQGPEASPIQNKGISASVVFGEFYVSSDQSQIQQGSVQKDKQGASSMQKMQVPSRLVAVYAFIVCTVNREMYPGLIP
ncbi:unnamed protein product [Miscanthus lutarioriparius]|uniref:Uncharacterized protein n=1 Tax=Miscanthus lutarioriparius TaxID=422564 RepID=A0A811N5Z0_9POAL|nr:unnamed protein product [Miscanthus lutarioriparius]